MTLFDVAIVGGGPAGAASAIALARRGLTVALLERTRHDDFRPGETLPPRIKPILIQLGVWQPFLELAPRPSFGIKSAWGSPTLSETTFIANPYGHGWHVDRRRFDAMLVAAAARAGAAVRCGCRFEGATVAGGDAFRVSARDGGKPLSLLARRLIDATGRAASVARALGAQRVQVDTMVALIGELAGPVAANQAAEAPGLVLESTSDGWWYAAPLPAGTLLVTHLTDARLLGSGAGRAAALWRERLGCTIHIKALVPAQSQLLALHVRKADSGHLSAAAGPGWVATGDAASTREPLSAGGITNALTTGAAAAAAIADDLQGEPRLLRQYGADIGSAFARYLLQRHTQYSRETRWPTSPFWRDRRRTVGRPREALAATAPSLE